MSSFRRPARGLSVTVVLAAVVAAVGRWLAASAPASASAFKIQNHERVTRDALTPVGVDSAALGQILVGPHREPVRSSATPSSPTTCSMPTDTKPAGERERQCLSHLISAVSV